MNGKKKPAASDQETTGMNTQMKGNSPMTIPNTPTIGYTPNQLDGLACVRCGRPLDAAVPVGLVDGRQHSVTSDVEDEHAAGLPFAPVMPLDWTTTPPRRARAVERLAAYQPDTIGELLGLAAMVETLTGGAA